MDLSSPLYQAGGKAGLANVGGAGGGSAPQVARVAGRHPVVLPASVAGDAEGRTGSPRHAGHAAAAGNAEGHCSRTCIWSRASSALASVIPQRPERPRGWWCARWWRTFSAALLSRCEARSAARSAGPPGIASPTRRDRLESHNQSESPPLPGGVPDHRPESLVGFGRNRSGRSATSSFASTRAARWPRASSIRASSARSWLRCPRSARSSSYSTPRSWT